MRTATWLLAGLMACCALADEPKKRALLVGVNVYQKRGFPDLEFAERDATELAAALKPMGFEVRLLLGSGAGDAAATKANIEAQIAATVADVGKEDVVLVFFAGHGQQLPSLRVAGVEDAYFCPREAESRTPATMVSLSALTDDVLAKKGGKNLLLVDACRDTPPDPDRGARGVQGKVVALPEDTAILFACRAGQVSRENARHGGGHGLFTHAVLEGLRGKAAADGRIDWGGLVGHVGRSMRAMQATIPAAARQEPIAAGVVGHIDLGPAPVLAVADRGKPELRREMPAKQSPSETPPPKAGGDYASRSTNMAFKLIPAGSFMMGSPEAEAQSQPDERPTRQVRITKAFYMGRTEVTQAQYKAVTGENPSYFNGDDLPVETVNWFDAVKFCNALSAMDGKRPCYRIGSGEKPTVALLPDGNGYRLPTEAEWEFACRGGKSGQFGFDGALTPEKVNYDGNYPYDGAAKGEYREKTVAAGSLPANAFGLHEMHGNVWEWCWDAYDKDYYQAGGNTADPQGPTSADTASLRTPRGGSWVCNGWCCRSACRSGHAPDYRNRRGGFRVIAVPE